jgi:polyketide synthase PksJ
MNQERIESYKTFVDVIQDKCETNNGIIFIDSIDNDRFISYPELYRRALRVLYNLQQSGIKPGCKLVFQIGNNFDFISVFWACIMGHIIPVPVATAFIERFRFKLFNIWKILDNPYLIISKSNARGLEQFAAEKKLDKVYEESKKQTIYIEDIEKFAGEGEIYFPQESDIAFIQFSSGSTSQSKGVILTHKNLLINIRAIIKGLKSPGMVERYLSWMPLTHDMGFIGLHLVPFTAGWHQSLMSTTLFTRYPLLWLRKITEHKITLSGAPNSGFKHVLRYFTPGKNNDIDLSLLRVIFNGAEPIAADLCNEFLKKLAPTGLKKSTITPSYGLAEASVAVSFGEPADDIVEVVVDRNFLNIGQKVIEIGRESTHAITFVEVGAPIDNCCVRILGDNNEEFSDRIVGHIQVKGGNVTSGYYNNREATEEVITADGWLDTGDLGFYRDGRLVVTGRVKDTIIVNGITYYAHDIEFVCEELEELKNSRVVVCGVYNPQFHSDEIICFVTYKKMNLEDFQALAAAIKKQVVKKAGAVVSQVIPVKQIPTTTSGKIQRYQLKERFLSGEFDSLLREIPASQENIISD